MRNFASVAILAIITAHAHGRAIDAPPSSSVAADKWTPRTILEPSSLNDLSLARRKEWPDHWYHAASDEEAQQAFCKGSLLYYAMQSTDGEAAKLFDPSKETIQSQFTQFPEEFKKWGWEEEDVTWLNIGSAEPIGIENALAEMGSTVKPYYEGGTLRVVMFSHKELEGFTIDTQTYEVDGKTYRMTGGFFILLIDPTNGILVGQETYSAAHQGQRRSPKVEGDGLPKLKSASDIYWGAYQMASSTNNIRWFLSTTIENEETLQIMKYVLDEAQAELQPWPGLDISTDSADGRRLLGTPNGRGFAYMLIQHKSVLGEKYISHVRIFHSEADGEYPCLALKVDDAPSTGGFIEPA